MERRWELFRQERLRIIRVLDYRGFMVDVGRHFFSVDYLKEIIDMLAMHHINYFHWHLTEDQGWRIEIKKYPKLTEIGSHRKETITAPGSDKYDGVPVSGYYTQEEAQGNCTICCRSFYYGDTGN